MTDADGMGDRAIPTDNPADAPTGERLVRAIAVGNRINMAAATSEASYVAELERIVGLAAPHLAPDHPNLLTLTELLGLPAALVGARGRLARRAKRSQAALGMLAAAYAPRILRIRRRWPGVSLARALLLARADALYRPLAETLARLAAANHTHIVATTLAPRLRRATDLREIAAWGEVGASAVYIPTAPEVYNAALIFGPDGALLGRVEKVFLTKSEIATLDLTPGRLEDVRVIATDAGRLGVAISLDAFTPAYLRRLAEQRAEIVVQPDANDQPWAAPSATNDWQPAEWLNSVLGSIQPIYPSLRYNICAMQTGNFFDIVFDGQSSVTARNLAVPPDGRLDPAQTFVGVDAHRHTATGEALVGGFLALAPWVAPDPAMADPTLTLADRRARLMARGRTLAPGGSQENAYRESVIWADLRLDPSPPMIIERPEGVNAMSEQPAHLIDVYSGWENYQQLMVEAIAPLTPDQLTLRAAPDLRSIGEIATHMIGARARWFYEGMGAGGPEIEPLRQWDREGQPVRNAAELEEGLETTWRVIHDCLTRWTTDDLAVEVFARGKTRTRRWIIWHVIEHDLRHGGEISLTLGMHGLRAPDL